jgi:hypothetical protein
MEVLRIMQDESIFLSANDLIALTGFSKPSKQCEYLAKLGIPYYKNAIGRPQVVKSQLTKDRQSHDLNYVIPESIRNYQPPKRR